MIKKDKIFRNEIISFSFRIGADSISVSDLGWWIERQTDNQYTTIEKQFIIDAIKAFNTIEKCRLELDSTDLEKFKYWLDSLDYFTRNRLYITNN